MKNLFLKYFKETKAVTAVEYGLIVGGVGIAIIASVFLVGDSLELMFNTLSNFMDGRFTTLDI
jgi:pilus assembly protein Flp/PilA